MKKYFIQTNGLLYSYLISIPLLLLYEILILISQPRGNIARISVDVWFKSFFTYFGWDAISTTLIAAAIIGGIIVYKKRDELKSVRKNYFLLMIGEAAFYAILVAIIVSSVVDFILLQSANGLTADFNKLQLIALSLGAGLYEELFFRVILVSFLIFVFDKIFKNKNYSTGVSIVAAALIFSGVHYVGDFADSWLLSSFLFRFLFGLALNLIYVIRGFGLAAWTHAIYDLIVVINL
ncbi:CPBP family intramembrane glutamic endopeptidase [Rhodohalobacter sp.]|uniref:CPBP family intramembrane glutamic endopeptidase n=1 Tax=Rhodohalobacter sp. TaxID=1974210 RepID=UPI002ACD99BD|nr:CPBP family intramembrane glutamic endopeptidase [Rhodohalobacter sp.]MDZ7758334.1 CPBP family intramembrane glutamic endopeptidase [Rhodohalobacter sp.]